MSHGHDLSQLKVSSKEELLAEHIHKLREGYAVKPNLEYMTIRAVNGPLVILENVRLPKFAEIVNIELPDGTKRRGQVLEIDGQQGRRPGVRGGPLGSTPNARSANSRARSWSWV